MSMLDRFRKLLRPNETVRDAASAETELIYVLLPEAIDPDTRFERYEAPLDAELQLTGIGFVSGGGALMSAPKPDGSCDILYCGVDVDTTNVDCAHPAQGAFAQPWLQARHQARIHYR